MSNEVFHLHSALGINELYVYEDHLFFLYTGALQRKIQKLGYDPAQLANIPYEDILEVSFQKGTIFKNGMLLIGTKEILEKGPLERSPAMLIFYPNRNKEMNEAYEYINARKGKKCEPTPAKKEEPKKEDKEDDGLDSVSFSSTSGGFESFSPSDYDSLADELVKLKKLHDQGVLDDEEFKAAKAKLLKR